MLGFFFALIDVDGRLVLADADAGLFLDGGLLEDVDARIKL